MIKKKLNEISRLLNGYAFKSSKYVQSGLRVIRIANVQDGYLSDSEPCFYPIETTTELEQFLLKPHDLLMSLTGNVGRVAFIEKEYLPAGLNQRVECIRPFEEADKEYLYYFFRSPMFQRESLKASHGSAQLNLSTVWLANFYVVYPDEEKRKTVVNTLRTIDNLIREKRNQLIKLDCLVKSRFMEMFMQGQCDIYPLKKWSEVATIKHGKDYKKSITKKGGYPVFGSGGFMGVFANGFITKKNSTLIGRKGTLDKPIFVKENVWNVDTAFGVEPDEDIVNSTFFFHRSCLYDYKSLSTSTTLPSMTKSTLESLSIGIPPMELQKNFASFVELIDKSRFVCHSRNFL